MRKLKHLSLAFVCLIVYFVMCFALSHVFDSSIVSMVVGDVLGCVSFGFIYMCLCKTHVDKENRYKFSNMAIFIIVLMFFCMYFFAQMAATWVGIHYPSNYLQVYSSLSGDDLLWYLILAVTAGPIVEEFLFRGILYKYLRQEFGMWFCIAISCATFSLMHGTTEHIPLTVSLTFFSCFIMELTGEFRYCILIHILMNLCSLIFVMRIPIPPTVGFIGFSIILIILTISLLSLDVLREKFRKVEGKPTLEERLNEKKNHWGE